MEDFFGRNAEVGDKIIIQGTGEHKSLHEVFVCKLTTNFGSPAMVTCDTKEMYDFFIENDGYKGRTGYNNTRSDFIILENKTSIIQWTAKRC